MLNNDPIMPHAMRAATAIAAELELAAGIHPEGPEAIEHLAAIISAEFAGVATLVEAAKAALATADEPCRADHHGYCQTHNLEPVDRCWVKLCRSALAEWEAAK